MSCDGGWEVTEGACHPGVHGHACHFVSAASDSLASVVMVLAVPVAPVALVALAVLVEVQNALSA